MAEHVVSFTHCSSQILKLKGNLVTRPFILSISVTGQTAVKYFPKSTSFSRSIYQKGKMADSKGNTQGAKRFVEIRIRITLSRLRQGIKVSTNFAD